MSALRVRKTAFSLSLVPRRIVCADTLLEFSTNLTVMTRNTENHRYLQVGSPLFATVTSQSCSFSAPKSVYDFLSVCVCVFYMHTALIVCAGQPMHPQCGPGSHASPLAARAEIASFASVTNLDVATTGHHAARNLGSIGFDK